MFLSSACKRNHFSPVQLSVTLQTIASQAPLFMDSLGKNTGVGFHVLPQGIFPGIKPSSHVSWVGRSILYTSATMIIVISSSIENICSIVGEWNPYLDQLET